ncbi:MAG TPA: glyoxalase superfamily protein [Polyangiaceae bacterium]|jgi:lactoylglutathione lyase
MSNRDEYAANRFQKGVPDFPVKDCPAALRYYLDVLGFRKDFDDAVLGFDHTMFCGVSRGECALTLNEHGHEERSPSGMSCNVDDVDLLHDEYRARGVQVTQPPKDMPWGQRSVHFVDPDGNSLVFAASIKK